MAAEQPYDHGLLPRTYFRAPRVPFDIRALGLGILGFLVYWAGGKLISGIMAPEGEGGSYDVPGAFLAWAFRLFGDIPYIGEQVGNLLRNALRIDPGAADYGFWEYAIGGLWFIGVWSFFAQGIHRITTMRIARDEGMPITEALKFSAKNWPTVLLAPVIIAGTIAIFWLCNLAAGFATSLPFVGGLLGIVLYPLAFISTLLMLLIGLGGVFGLPLIGAAAAWECNGSLDAISRAFSYLFARPLQFFWNFLLIFMFTGVIILVGSWFTFAFAKSLDSGIVHSTLSVAVDPPTKTLQEGSDFSELPDDARKLYDDLESADLIDARLVRDRRPDTPLLAPPVMNIAAVGKTPWKFKLNALILWALLNLIWLGVSGYALYWLLGASTSVYADLRADVDGTEEDEVYIEEEDMALDELAEGGPAVEGAAAAPAAESAPEPAPEPKTDDGPEADASDEGGDEKADEKADE